MKTKRIPLPADTVEFVSKRPAPQDRLFTAPSIEKTILDVQSKLSNKRLASEVEAALKLIDDGKLDLLNSIS